MTALGQQAPSVRVIDCPSCGGSLELRAAGFTTRLVCQYCASELDLVDEQVRLLAEHAEAANQLTLPLGTRGTLKGVEWCAIGYLERGDTWENWGEYLLFNPYHGYRWLVHQHSGWSLGEPLLIQPAHSSAQTLLHDGQAFKQCHTSSTTTVRYVLGEFYWQVQRGEEVQSIGFVSGQRMLIGEAKRDEYEWTIEEWIDSRAVAKAFAIADTGQYPKTARFPLPHHPNPHRGLLHYMALVAGIAAALALVVMLFLGAGGQRLTATLTAGDSLASRQAVLGPFAITGQPRPFVIHTRGEPGSDNWLDVEYELVRLSDEETRLANQPIEYYSGPDWVEDDRRGTLKLSALPPGTYELRAEVVRPGDEVDVNAPMWVGDNVERTVEITAGPGGAFWSNLFALLIALFTPVLWVFARYAGFETARRTDYDIGGIESDDDDD
jgi:hypothetical protein